MSILPQYQRISAIDDDAPPPWSKTSRPSFDDVTYPPRPGPSSSFTGIMNVTYTWEPRWPIKGTAEDVIGAMGRNKEVSHTPTHPLKL